LLNIVLYQPRIPQNTGNVARSCFVTGSRLHLVGPMGFRIDEAKLREAITKTGYDFVSMTSKPYEKHGLFGFLKK
jgi:tRNA(Leu) C34 or U34 (ribose-2'-O)-methylase TrmL